MSQRAVHMYEWDGGTEADQDLPDQVYCGTEGGMGDEQLTSNWSHVTCKRCLKARAKQLARWATDERDQKARLYDDALAIVDNLGHENIVTALRCLIAEVETLRRDAMRYQVLRQADLDTVQNGGLFAGQVPDNKVINGVELDELADAVIDKQNPQTSVMIGAAE